MVIDNCIVDNEFCSSCLQNSLSIKNIKIKIIAAVCGGGSQIFNSSGLYFVPPNVASVTVVAIGGGGGGANGHMPGGGGGYVQCGTFNVTSGTSIQVTVGKGGNGSMTQANGNNNIVGNTNGTASSFDTKLVAPGGRSGNPGTGCAGGSGSGCNCLGFCNNVTYGGSGGSGGADGSSAGTCLNGGLGQGTAAYAACLQMATLHTLAAGAGGRGGLNQVNTIYSYGPSGGGGGILVDGIGPSAGDGSFYRTT